MTEPFNVVVLNGSPHVSSRTRVLLDAITQELRQDLEMQVHQVLLHELVPYIATVLDRADVPMPASLAFQQIEAADLLIVGCPVFRAGLPGLFKHLFDLVDMSAMKGKAVLLAATGGSDRHTLVLDHQLRPLFGFFQCLTLPVGVYAGPADIVAGRIATGTLREQIALSVAAARPCLQQRESVAAEIAA